MTTVPPGTPRQHLERLRQQISVYFPRVENVELRFFDVRNAPRFFGIDVVSSDSVLEEKEFKDRFEALISDRVQWVNIAGNGFWWDSSYFCTFDHSKAYASAVSEIDLYGVSLAADGTPRLTASVVPGLLEQVAERLRPSGSSTLADRVLSVYNIRRLGNWDDEQLIDLNENEFRLVEQLIRDSVASFERRGPATSSTRPLFVGCLRLLNQLLANMRSDKRSAFYNTQ
jgi:hypothetical protein